MASITSMMSNTSSTSSIYGNRNVLSGLASGMDTETMIENAVSGIKTKIQNLLKKRTKIEWQQEAYRSIIDKAANFNTKYTSYSSKTNLLSSSFFTNAVNTDVLGTYADKVTASGKTSSDIKINAVKQMATSATYSVSGLANVQVGGITGTDFNISEKIPVSTVSGTLTFKYGGTNGASFDIKFDELENIEEFEGADNAEKLANAINQKLSEVTYSYTKSGFQESTTADKAIKAVAKDGQITFTDAMGNGNSISISSATGNMRTTFGLTGSAGKVIKVGNTALSKDTPTSEYLAGKELGLTFNGTTKKISMDEVLKNTNLEGSNGNKSFVDSLQKELDNAFGSGKVKAAYEGGKLSLTPSGKGDVLALGGTAVEALGFESGDANYVNTGKKITDILGDGAKNIFTEANRLKGTSEAIQKTSPNGNIYYVDSAGNRVDKDGYRIDSDGKAIYDFEVNGAHINVTEDTTLESLMNSINSNPDAGVKVSYSKLTNEFKFTTTDTGANAKIEFGGLAKGLFGDPAESKVTVEPETKLSDILGDSFTPGKFKVTVGGEELSFNRDADSTVTGTVYWLNEKIKENEALNEKGVKASYDYDKNEFVFTDKDGKKLDASYGEGVAQDFVNATKSSYVTGQDAVMDVEINGVRFENLTRSSNSFDLDGLTVNVKGTFNEDGSNIDKDGNTIEPVSFNTTTDTEKIIEVIREFVNDYNEMATEIKNAYTTQPLTDSNKNRYDPLTAEQEEQYTESELAAYNEKAKTGLLFGDTTLSSFYSKMLNAIQPGGADGQTLREIGIGTSYSDGMTTLSLDEDKLRTALENDPDKVKNAFTKTREGGATSDGLMQTMQNTLNTYVKTTGEPKGVLITKAGSVKAPTSLNNNSLLSQINSLDTQVERWQNKMSDQIDRYTTQFSRLEQLIAEMNSQASAFSGLMGGSTGY